MALKDKVVVRLTDEQRDSLRKIAFKGTHPAAKRRRAHILLLADDAGDDPCTDTEIAEGLEISSMTVRGVRKQFVNEGLSAIERKKPTGRQYRKLDGAQEAQLVALAGSRAPEGRARWTMRLLADKLVELQVVESINSATVCRTLKKRRKTVAETAAGHPTQGQRRVRRQHGGRPRRIRPTA
jgi:transposase